MTFDGTKQHPIGMDYAAYSSRDNKNYKPAAAFNSKMTFVNGRVGCTTCHDPLNLDKGHLVMSDTRSALCLTCHNR
jgi:predicted CXXCH cytochrome family protein